MFEPMKEQVRDAVVDVGKGLEKALNGSLTSVDLKTIVGEVADVAKQALTGKIGLTDLSEGLQNAISDMRGQARIF